MSLTYSINTSHLQRRELIITLHLPASGTDSFPLQLPLWRPGRYERQQYERSIGQVKILTPNARIERNSTHTWTVFPEGNDFIQVQYLFQASRLDAGGSFTDVDLIYINPVNCLLYDPSRPNLPCTLEVDIPSGFDSICALPRAGNTWSAPNADALFDSPLLASTRMQHHAFAVQENTLHLWFHGAHTLDFQKLEVSFRAFTEAQIKIFGEMPCKEFHFLFLISEGRSYHGVEHPDSTVITLGPAAELMKGSVWNDLLSISSHELFHLWNVKRIRPADLQPYDYTREQYSELHDITEGFTTYYGELMLHRSTVWTQEEWIDEMNDILNKHLDAPGKEFMTLTESSFISWVNGYHAEGIPQQKISFYHKGALVAMLLDLKLRDMTEHRQSLDSLMKRLWEDYKKPGYTGYTRQTILNHLKEMGFVEAEEFYLDFISGQKDVLQALQAILPTAGLQLEQVPLDSFVRSRLGLKLTPNPDGTAVVMGIIPGSPGWDTSLHVGDTLLTVAGEMPGIDLESFLRGYSIDHTDAEISFVSRGIHRVCRIQLNTGYEEVGFRFAHTGLTAE
jgi:predicted metalloprotease with PDZ domain